MSQTPESPAAGPHLSRQPCGTCGLVHERCTGHNNRGEPCRRWPTQGVEVCDSHGAQLPSVKAAAARNVAEREARRAVSLLDPEPVVDVLAAMARLAGRVVAWEQLCAERVERLQEIRYTAEGVGTEQLRAEVAVFSSALAECRQTLAVIARLDIDNRLAKISEQQAHVMMRVVEVALVAAGTAGAAAERGRAAAAGELRAAS
jgi:hypothetical protein